MAECQGMGHVSRMVENISNLEAWQDPTTFGRQIVGKRIISSGCCEDLKSSGAEAEWDSEYTSPVYPWRVEPERLLALIQPCKSPWFSNSTYSTLWPRPRLPLVHQAIPSRATTGSPSDSRPRMSARPVRRLTLFKIPRVEDQERLLEIYRNMPQEALRVRCPLQKWPAMRFWHLIAGRQTLYCFGTCGKSVRGSACSRLYCRGCLGICQLGRFYVLRHKVCRAFQPQGSCQNPPQREYDVLFWIVLLNDHKHSTDLIVSGSQGIFIRSSS